MSTDTPTAEAQETSAETAPAAPVVPSPVRITEKAAVEIKRVITEKQMPEDKATLRIKVAGGGCSGFSYGLGFVDSYDEAADFVADQHGVRVAVDKKSALFLEGTTIDFHDGIDKRGFTFDNPNATNTCGCGSSFSA